MAFGVWASIAASLVKIGDVATNSQSGVWKVAKTSTETIVKDSVEYAKIVCEELLNGQKKSYSGYAKTSELNELDFEEESIPENFAGLEAQMIPTRLKDQLFRITEVTEDEDYVTITARHVWYDNLENYTLWKPDEETQYTAAAAARSILSNAVSTPNMRIASDCKDKKVGKDLDFERKNLVEAFLDPENGLCAKFGLSLIRDNWDCYVLKNVGYDRGLVIQNGKNLLGVERNESIENLANRVIPYGKDDKGNIVWLNNNGNKWVDSPSHFYDYVNYPKAEMFDTGLQIGKDGVTAENIQEKLLAAGQKRFSDDLVDLPEVEMTIEFVSLGDTEEYIQYRGLDKVYLYDILSIKDTVRGYQYTAQVVAVEHDILTGMLNSVTIGKLNNWDGTRKIATWQVPEVSGENIRLKSIMAGTFAPGAISGDDIATGGVRWVHLDAASIDQLTTEQLTALTANIHTLIAGSITASDIVAGSITAALIEAGAITTDKLAANAITTEKLAASAITAEKIAAGTITANKLDTQSLAAAFADVNVLNSAIASIANAEISTANITTAHIVDLSAENFIAKDAVTDRYFIHKLAVENAQIVLATVGNLIVKASNGNYYKIDINAQGGITTTDVTSTLTNGEKVSGVTLDGKGTIIETDLTVADLAATNMKGINALIDKITASRIDVDELFARTATINQLNAVDIRGNTYLQLMVAGYGTTYTQATDPASVTGNTVKNGDVWFKGAPKTYSQMASFTYSQLASYTHKTLEGFVQYVRENGAWRLVDDPTEIRHQIAMIGIDINQVGIRVEDSWTAIATLIVRADQIAQRVQADENNFATLTVSVMSIESRVQGVEDGKISKTTTLQTATDIVSEAVSQAATAAGNSYIAKTTSLQTADSIVTEAKKQSATNVAPAFSTSTAYAVGARVSYNGDIYKFTTAHAAGAWNSNHVTKVTAEGSYLAKTTNLQTADSIVSEAVSQAASAASGAYIAKTTNLQTADAIQLAAEKTAAVNIVPAFSTSTAYAVGDFVSYNGKVYKFTSAHSAGAWNSSHVTTSNVKEYVSAKSYAIKSGVEILAEGVAVSGNKYIKLDVSASNYVHIDQNGIDVKGNRVKVNGKEVFARDDIIILTASQNESSVISSMNGKHDWVLIKPYYNAEIDFEYGQDYSSTSAGYNNNICRMARESGGQAAFGSGASWYQYQLEGDIIIGSGETHSSGVAFALTLSNSQSLTSPVTATATIPTDTGQTAHISMSTGHVSTNLCGEGQSIWFRLDSAYAYAHIRNLRLICTCDATTSKVPCTVYYFP